MSKAIYLYLDDDTSAAVTPYKRRVESTDRVEINYQTPVTYEQQIRELIEGHSRREFDGLILDLRLDRGALADELPVEGEAADQHGSAPNQVFYRATTLAQEIRTRMTETDSGLSAFPIALWSTEPKLEESYWRDSTSHDLFDIQVIKGRISANERGFNAILAIKLADLVIGYQLISSRAAGEPMRPFHLLGVSEKPELLDRRIAVHLVDSVLEKPVHEQARFIRKELLETPNVSLINREVLAARLGIDVEASSDFDNLLTRYFAEARYTGPFAEGWPCWWFLQVEALWDSLSGSADTLRRLSAPERVSFLKELSQLGGLVAAKPLEHATSSAFWAICAATDRPIDTRDGYKVRKQPPYLWQDATYISLVSKLDGSADEKRLKLHPVEDDRYEREKAKIRKGTSKNAH